MTNLKLLEQELVFLGLLDPSRKIYRELGCERALAYIESNYHLLSKIYHPDVNPHNIKKANILQQRLNEANQLISQSSEEDLIRLLENGTCEEAPAKKKILIVEDEIGIQETLRDVLVIEGYDVRTATDGNEGYKAYLQFKPELIITDIIMPQMSGIELIKKIRPKNPHIDVIYMTGFSGFKNLRHDINDEVSKYGYHFIAKPFKISVLLPLINKCLLNESNLNIYA